jgi:hypothetical protein
MVETKTRGWIYLIVGILAIYFTWSGRGDWAVYLLAASMVLSGYHHAFGQHK